MLVLYDGAIVRTLQGSELNERNLDQQRAQPAVRADDAGRPCHRAGRRRPDVTSGSVATPALSGAAHGKASAIGSASSVVF